ncbi:9397_t:CDS:1 [Acaulospora morrowiae]|uniref:9397_t:CDS:1 n=1 Tax=Acaulospora morrowiae TaxID=94023 RepID=A0A9N9EKK2_9GLOM|nr:9397_t:CDS:1 [Acaulospora morrowiae]
MSKFHSFNIFLALTLLLFANLVLSTPIANPEPEPVAEPNPSSVTSSAETTQDMEKRFFGGGFGGYGGYGAGYQNQAGYSTGMYGGYGGLGGLGYGGLGYGGLGGLGYGGMGYGGLGYGGLGYGGLGGVPILKKRDIDTNTPQQLDIEKRDPSATQDAQPFVLVKRVADPFIGGGMGMGLAYPGAMGALPLAAMPAAALPIAALPAAGFGMI